MTISDVIGPANLFVGLSCVALLLRQKAPPPVDPTAIARAILRAPFDAADVREAMAVAASVEPNHGRYLVQHTPDGGKPVVVYEGTNSDKAYAAHVAMEREPSKYPGQHQYIRDGEIKVNRHHSEIR